MSEDLKPSPFCGSTDVEVWPVDEYVKCNDCEAEGPWSFEQGETEAVELWNRRADPIARLEAWRAKYPQGRAYTAGPPVGWRSDPLWSVTLIRPANYGVITESHMAPTLAEAVDAALKGDDDAKGE